jgi:hypothetical protein
MKTPRRLTTRGTIVASVTALALLGLGGVALADIPSSTTKVFTACINKQTGAVRIINFEDGKRCTAKEKRVRWNKRGRTGATGPVGPAGPAGPPGAANIVPSDMRFSLMWLTGGAWRNAVIRGDGSLRLSSDPSLAVTRVSAGVYCIKVENPEEGAVAALQNQTGDLASRSVGTIDVTMGVGNPCGTALSGAQISVRTFAIT